MMHELIYLCGKHADSIKNQEKFICLWICFFKRYVEHIIIIIIIRLSMYLIMWCGVGVAVGGSRKRSEADIR